MWYVWCVPCVHMSMVYGGGCMFMCMRCLCCVCVFPHVFLSKEQRKFLTMQKQLAQLAPRSQFLKVIVSSKEAKFLGEKTDGRAAAGAELDEPASCCVRKQGSAQRRHVSKQTESARKDSHWSNPNLIIRVNNNRLCPLDKM